MRKRDVRQELKKILEEQFIQGKDNEWISIEKLT